jgi:hypothetical protein
VKILYLAINEPGVACLIAELVATGPERVIFYVN